MKFGILKFILIGIALFMCSKRPEKTGNVSAELGDLKGAPPTTQPTFSGLIESHVHQWKRLSIGYAMLLNDPAMCLNYDLKVHINNLVAANQGMPVRNNTVYNDLLTRSFNFNQPTPTHHDLYNALENRINSMSPPTSIGTWDNTFFGSFLHNDGLSIDPYFVTIAIPLRSLQAQNGHWFLPALVCPDPELFGFPMTAYGFSSSGGASVIEVPIPDWDAYDDLIEGGTHMIFSLQFEYDQIDEKEIQADCEGGYTVGDNLCNGGCGENETNSPNDCGDHNKNKVVYLKQIRINNDVANRDQSQNLVPLKQHWEMVAAGRYEPGFSSWTLGNNGIYEAIKKVKLEKVTFDDVKRTRIKKNGNSVSRGTSNWRPGFEKNTTDEAIVSFNYNPTAQHLYIFFYESDGMKRQKIYTNVPLDYLSTTFDSLYWRGERGNMTSGKWGSAIWGLRSSWSGNPAVPNASSYYVKIFPNPLDWVDEQIGGEDVKVYYYNSNIINDCDFVLYYYTNKHGK